ncbi:MAG: HAMP domain-containing histidine kinase [Candidatus Riflebacteria bacterium]|nr:HAMP domain-containing histidine kinase [Candidatus Riflebacteria bacterium]
MSSAAFKYTLLFGLLLLPVFIFTHLSLWSIELEAEEAAERRKDVAVKRVAGAIAAFKAEVHRRLEHLVRLSAEHDTARIEKERGVWEVYVFDRELRLVFPQCRPCPALDSPVPEKESQLLYRAWLKGRDAAGLKRVAARLYWTSSSPRIQASSLARLAAAAAAGGDHEGALQTLRLLSERYPGARDLTGLALGPAAALSVVRCQTRLKRRPEAVKTLVGLLFDLTFARYPLYPQEWSYFIGEIQELISGLEKHGGLTTEDRDTLSRLLESPFPRLYGRYKAGSGMRVEEGRIEHFGGRQYIQFDRRTADRVVLALAPVEEMSQTFAQTLGPPFMEGYRVFTGAEVPQADAERFTSVMRLEVPYLGSPVTLAADRAQLVSLARTRKTFLSSVVSLGLVMFFLGGFLIARDVKRHLELARLKAEFIGNVSHELKTPLTTIRMFAETLFHGRCRKDRERDYLRRILSESDHLTLLIENVLQLSRAEEVVIDGRQSTFDLDQVAAAAVDRLKVRWENRPVDVRIAPGIELDGDVNLLTLALANLLDNAAKYGGDGQTIQLLCGFERGQAFLSVSDRGRGVPERDRKHIFTRFFRAGNTTDASGMGLGLFLVQRIVDMHHGLVEFQSQEGVGSTFTIRVPARVKEQTEPAGQPAPKEERV